MIILTRLPLDEPEVLASGRERNHSVMFRL